jgi:putative inorganic carbon (HCO3(-)) transporter
MSRSDPAAVDVRGDRQPSRGRVPGAAMMLAAFAGIVLVAGVARPWAGLLHWHDSQRLLQGLLLLAVGAAVASLASLRSRLFLQAGRAGPAPWVLAAGAGLVGVVSALCSGFAAIGLTEVALFTLLALLALAVMDARDASPAAFDRTGLVVVMAASLVLVVLFGASYAAALLSEAGFHAENLYRGGFSNPRAMGQFHTMALPLMAAACLHAGLAARWRALCLAVLVVTLVVALLAASRATWYAWSAATLVVLLVCPRAGRRLLPLLALALVAALAGFWLLFHVLPPMFIGGGSFDAQQSYERLAAPFGLRLRDVLWARAAGWSSLFPVLGIGPAGLALDFNPVAAHPHSAPLQVAAEWGLPALAMIATALGLAGWRMAAGLRAACHGAGATADTPTPVLAASLAIALCGALIHSLVDGMIVMPQAQVALACVCGWAAACLLPPATAGTQQSPRPARRPSLRSLAGALAAGGAMAALFNAVAPWVAQRDLLDADRARDEQVGLPTVPRFWSNGFLLDRVDLQDVRFLRANGPGVPERFTDPRLALQPGTAAPGR